MNWYYISLSYLSLLGLGFCDNIRGPVFADIMKEFDLSNSAAAWVFASTSTSVLLTSTLSPRIIKKLKVVGTLSGSLLLMGLSLFFSSLAPNFIIFILGACVFGFSIGSLGVSQNLLATLGSSKMRREQILNGLHAMYALASILAPGSVSMLSALGLDWRGFYRIAAGLCLFILIIFRILPLLNRKISTNFSETSGEQKGVGNLAISENLFGDRIKMIFFSLVISFYVIAEILVGTRLALYLRVAKGETLAISSLYVTGFFVAMFVGRSLFTLVTFSVSNFRQMALSLVGSFSFLCLGLFYSPWGFVLSGIGMAPFYPLAMAYLSHEFRENVTVAISWVMSISAVFIVGMHLTVGILADKWGVYNSLFVGPLFLCVALLLLIAFEFFKRIGLRAGPNVKSNAVITLSVFIGFGILFINFGGINTVQARVSSNMIRSIGRVDQVLESRILLASSSDSEWRVGDIVAIQSRREPIEVVAFVEVVRLDHLADGNIQLRLELIRHSRAHFVELGDRVLSLDLSKADPSYKGTTDLLVRQRSPNISAKYKPLFYLGALSETAQSLWENEIAVTHYGLTEYGLKDWITVGSLLPGWTFGGGNFFFKSRALNTESNTVSMGLQWAQIPGQTTSAVNYNLYWDAISTESVVNHTSLSIALFTFDRADENTAIRSIGTSTLTTGYEFILDNWDRILVGPSFNVEKKSVGGYLGYVFIWDHFHLQLSLSSTNIASLKFAPRDGYYAFIDAYWRF